MGILGAIASAKALLIPAGKADLPQGGAIGPELIDDHDARRITFDHAASFSRSPITNT
jgi:hypothetical protein